MNKDDKIQSIAIIGGGTSGWSTAALLGAILKDSGVKITLIESSDIPTIGVGEATIPPIFEFLRNIGADEVEFIRQCQATFKLAILFKNWVRQGQQYWHPFGNLGITINQRPFHHYWWKNKTHGHDENFADFCPAIALAEDNKFAFPSPDGNWPGGAVAYAMHFDAGLVAKFLRDHSQKAGVIHHDAKVERSKVRDGEWIDGLILNNGDELTADLYIDCTGFRGLLIEEALQSGYVDWSNWLPCDRAVAVQSEPHETRTPYTIATAKEAGWQWRIPLQNRIGNGYVYSSTFTDDDRAAQSLLDGLDSPKLAEPRFLKFTAGYRKSGWIGNCIAIGLSAGFLEPLESTSIHLIHTGLNRLLDYFPDKNFDPALRRAYNAEIEAEYSHIRDFLLLHYYPNQRHGEPFWDAMRHNKLPDSLAHKMELFAQSGRISSRRKELFSDMSWFYVAAGMEITPKYIDPLADIAPFDEVCNIMGQMKGAMAAYRHAAPTHDAILNMLIDPNEKRRPNFGVGAGWSGR
ncbi:hypothetical protein LPB140_02500 [Sphingorhabdus lutea]|uniref:Tryptophan 7-halogenase n=1 Tax=Sphingorhabdus lutea TaxID=1913578 RepID=A0A1L3J9Q7_9SPHN|nr:tryptophan halogenase family protein [Sphingorhabdus lutea]APG61882.1 hypothetical protein LPB140_02500 [Sphingorhabdus lutea]